MPPVARSPFSEKEKKRARWASIPRLPALFNRGFRRQALYPCWATSPLALYPPSSSCQREPHMLLYRYILLFCVLDDTGAKCSEGNNAICGLKESIYKMCPAGYRALHLGKVWTMWTKVQCSTYHILVVKEMDRVELNVQPQHILFDDDQSIADWKLL